MAEATEACARGYFLGFGGTITFKKSDRLDVALSIPEERIILETDCPYLGPEPGAQSEPASVAGTAAFMAETWAMTPAQVEAQLADNFERLFQVRP